MIHVPAVDPPVTGFPHDPEVPPKDYRVTFGGGHLHALPTGVRTNTDSVIVLRVRGDRYAARLTAYALFGPAWCDVYGPKAWDLLDPVQRDQWWPLGDLATFDATVPGWEVPS